MWPQWDRVLETCVRRDATDVVLAPGCSVLLVMRGVLRALQVPPLQDEDIVAMANQVLEPLDDRRQYNGYVCNDCRYGYESDPHSWFRVFAFGHPITTFALLCRIAAPLPATGFPVGPDGHTRLRRARLIPEEPAAVFDFDELLQTHVNINASIMVLVAGVAPLVRVGDDAIELPVRPVTAFDLDWVWHHLGRHPYQWFEGDGYAYSGILHHGKTYLRIQMFGKSPSPLAVVVSRMPESAPSA